MVAAGIVAGTLIRSARHHTQPQLVDDERMSPDMQTVDALA
jgi:hypothetical protein